MKVVLDTNVLISGAFFTGAPSQIVDSCVDGRCHMIASTDIINEYQRVGDLFSNKHPNTDFTGFLSLLVANAFIVEPRALGKTVCRDPDDDKFIECAIAGKAQVIISGDKDLLAVSSYAGIPIVRPRKFLDEYLVK